MSFCAFIFFSFSKTMCITMQVHFHQNFLNTWAWLVASVWLVFQTVMTHLNTLHWMFIIAYNTFRPCVEPGIGNLMVAASHWHLIHSPRTWVNKVTPHSTQGEVSPNSSSVYLRMHGAYIGWELFDKCTWNCLWSYKVLREWDRRWMRGIYRGDKCGV